MASSRERERQLARERYERQQARKAAQRHHQRTTATVVVTVVVVLGVIAAMVALFALPGGSKAKQTLSQAKPSSSPSGAASPSAAGSPSAAAGTCTYTKAGTPAKDVGMPPATPGGQDVGVRIQLGQGTLQGLLYGTKAPCTVNSFTYLAAKQYFANTTCHRLTTSGIYVLQCGDPTGTGSGGPGYQFADENLGAFGTQPNQQTTYPAGTLAMANAGPGTNGSQFFIVYKDSPLAASYTPFGKITKGLDVVQQIAKVGTKDGGPDGAPKKPVTIKQIQVLQ